MNEITITLPPPHRLLSTNVNPDRMVKARLTKKHREWAGLAALARRSCLLEKAPNWDRVEITAVWFRKVDPKHKQYVIDQGNATNWLKAYEDGFADAGIYKNDRDVIWGVHTFQQDKKDPRIEITIRSLTKGKL